MAVVTARALEVGFRHLDAPLRWWEGPDTVIAENNLFVRGGNIILPSGAAPSWSITDPTGFSFSYLLAEDEAAGFFEHAVSNVPVKMYRFYRNESRQWAEQVQWRFEGVVGSADWDAAERLVQCAVVPLSATTKLQPRVGPWSRRSRPDTGFRWMRAKRKLLPLQENDVG